MKSLFEAVSELNVENEFSIQYQILGIKQGWDLMEKVKCEDILKRKLALFIAHAYSYESPLFRKKKNRGDVINNICEYIELEQTDFILECIQNRNKQLNSYSTWWLKETADRDFAIVVTLEDAMHNLLELSRGGIEANISCESIKETAAALKYFQKVEVTIKSDSMKRAFEMRNQIESLERSLEKKYDYIKGIVKEELPDSIDHLGWAERSVLKRKSNK